jgi:hypothetical protein
MLVYLAREWGRTSVKEIGRHGEAELLGRLEINYQLEFRRLFHRKIGGHSTFQNLAHKNGDASNNLGFLGSIGHQTTTIHNISQNVYRWQSIFYC